MKTKTVLLISQFFPPDPTAVGQYMYDVGRELVRRGFRVRVFAANCAYEDPSRRFAGRETMEGMRIKRFPFSNFGKGSIRARLIGGLLFTAQCILHGFFLRKHTILVTTSPPFSSIAALALGLGARRASNRARPGMAESVRSRKIGVVYWVMDLNPDQALALGVARPGSLSVRLFEALNRRILTRADRIVALDRFMSERIAAKADPGRRLEVLPPWPLENSLRPLDHNENPFREEQGWQERFVFMFSGNLSIASPADTLLEASLATRDDPRARFVFIGGGLGRLKLEEFVSEHGAGNIERLPYQPLDRIQYSLAAADVHLVTMGENMRGMIHPSKVYGALSVGRPLLFLGPAPSHVTDILDAYDCGWAVRHGDVDRAREVLLSILSMSPERLAAMGAAARRAVEEQFAKANLAGRFCDAVESTLTDRPGPSVRSDR